MNKQTFAHVIYTPFTGVGLHGGFRGNKWLKHRIIIFKKYTLQSLLNQSNRQFIHWMSFRSEERNNLNVIQLGEYLSSINYPFIFTFDGLMYWDDKFTSFSMKARLRNLLQMMWDSWINKEWRSISEYIKNSWENKNTSLMQRIGRSLSVLSQYIDPKHDWVYLTRIDSDDMFHHDVVDLIQSKRPEYKKALVFDKGYIFNVETSQLAEWNPPTNPPFHTIIFPGYVFFNSQQHTEYYEDFTTHEDIHRIFKCEILDTNKYCVSYHGKHISTDWNSPLPKKAYHAIKYGAIEPFKRSSKGYCYTTSGLNISTRWSSRVRHIENKMIGEKIGLIDKEEILRDFGITSLI